MEIHLDLIGGLAGDMFVAAMIDAFPSLEDLVIKNVESFSPSDSSLQCSVIGHQDGLFQGRRFEVLVPVLKMTPPLAATASYATHDHTSWKTIRERILRSDLAAGAIVHALGIFQLLAEAEGAVHGVSADEVSFHEVGAWDSIADIVAAAVLIDRLGATLWTCSPAPLGGGRISSAHGVIPVPAPAATRLLVGMQTLDDGVDGERMTPTGAAILRYLCPPTEPVNAPNRGVRRLDASGIGFGTRKLPGVSNCVRVLCFSSQAAVNPAGNRRIHVIEFEVDDQSGEELAAGLDRLRAHRGVLDVTQSAVFGKKGRMMVHVQVLARESHVEEVIEQCFRETTTIGLRRQIVQGVGLKRHIENVMVDGLQLRVKVAERPGGNTAKTEADDVVSLTNQFNRARLRARAETAVLNLQEAPTDA